jgi:hypothetical protein
MRLLVLLLVFLSTQTGAQLITPEQAEAYAKELVKQGFLTAKGKEVLLQEINKGAIEVEHRSVVRPVTHTSTDLSREIILQFCSYAISTELMRRLSKKGMAIEKKISPKEPIEDSLGRTYGFFGGMGGRKEYIGCIAPQTSVFGYTRIKTLTTFYKSGLIDEKVFKDCQAAISSKEIRDEVDLLRFMVNSSTYYRYYDFNKAEQINYITSLVKHGILPPDAKETLVNSYKDYELKDIQEILQHSPRFALVDLHAYEPNPKLTYPVIFEAVKKLVPQFRYSDLTVLILEQEESDLIREDVKLSFLVDSIRYTQSFFHNYRKANPGPNDNQREPSRVDQDFHKVFNKWLTDIESPFRLYTVNIMDDDERAYGERSVGLLLLKQGEDSLISSGPYSISRESFDQRLSRRNIRKLLDDFDANGFFTHLTRSEIDASKEKVFNGEINSIEDILLQFPKTIVVFDWETGNLKNPYEELTLELMEASRGAFKVSQITDEFEKGWKKAKHVQFGFTMNGKRYEKMLRFKGDWLDPAFLELLKSALSENKVDGQIHYCIDNGQEGGYIFLTNGQFKFMQEFYPDLLKGD